MQVERYIGRISGPLLDRIDIHVEVPNVPFRELSNKTSGTDSSKMRGDVVIAREMQTRRFEGQPGDGERSDVPKADSNLLQA